MDSQAFRVMCECVVYLLFVASCVWEEGGDMEHDLVAFKHRVDRAQTSGVIWRRRKGVVNI